MTPFAHLGVNAIDRTMGGAGAPFTRRSLCMLGRYMIGQFFGAIFGVVMFRLVLGWEGVTPEDLAICSRGSLSSGGAVAWPSEVGYLPEYQLERRAAFLGVF